MFLRDIQQSMSNTGLRLYKMSKERRILSKCFLIDNNHCYRKIYKNYQIVSILQNNQCRQLSYLHKLSIHSMINNYYSKNQHKFQQGNSQHSQNHSRIPGDNLNRLFMMCKNCMVIYRKNILIQTQSIYQGNCSCMCYLMTCSNMKQNSQSYRKNKEMN